MQRSAERFLTTHTGSLPRPEGLIRSMFAKEEGVPVEPKALAAAVADAVRLTVAKQVEAGIDIVNDGEMSKPSYATYVKDRLDGFGGASHPLQYQDLVDFPELARRVFGDPGRARRKTPGCTAPVRPASGDAARTDIANLRAALAAIPAQEGFLTAASPGLVSLFFHNGYYPSHEAYLEAISAAMRPEYEAIVGAGLLLQLDCPDLAMGRHIQFAALDLDGFRRMARLHIEALNRAVANLPPERMRLHLCWGNYEGPHHYDVPLADILDVVLGARPAGLSFEAANPRHAHEWSAVRHRQAAAGQGAHSRRHRIEVELHRASRTDRPAHRALCRAGRARERHRRRRLRLWHLGRDRPRSIPRWCGPSSRQWQKARGSPRAGSGASRRCASACGGDARSPPSTSRSAGKRIVAVVPRPSSLASASLPPCSAIIAAVSGRPRPVPLCERESELSTCSNGCSTRGMSSSAMPMPVSRMATTKPVSRSDVGG